MTDTGYNGPGDPKPVNKRWVFLIAENFMQSEVEGQFHATLLCNDKPRGLVKLLDGAELEWLNERLSPPQLHGDS